MALAQSPHPPATRHHTTKRFMTMACLNGEDQPFRRKRVEWHKCNARHLQLQGLSQPDSPCPLHVIAPHLWSHTASDGQRPARDRPLHT
jgi:hypothetical protein